MTTEAGVQLTPDSTGKIVRTVEVTTTVYAANGTATSSTKEQQVVTLALADGTFLTAEQVGPSQWGLHVHDPIVAAALTALALEIAGLTHTLKAR